MITEITRITDCKPARGWVLYDGACRLCRRLALSFRPALESRGFALAALQEPWVNERLRLPNSELAAEMRLLTPDGRVFGGADAVVEMARRIWWGRPLYAFAKIPAVRRGLHCLYRAVAKRRHCRAGACAMPERTCWPAWAPLLAAPCLAAMLRNQLPAWAFMWTLAVTIFATCKWLTWWRTRTLTATPDTKPYQFSSVNPSSRPSPLPKGRRRTLLALRPISRFSDLSQRGDPASLAPSDGARVRVRGSFDFTPAAKRSLGYLFAWPGMDAQKFLCGTPPASKPNAHNWSVALGKTLAGAALVWGAVRLIPFEHPILTGWTGLVGLVFLLHFGLFHLLALAWQAGGVNAQPIMNMPIRATSLSEFWGQRWNSAFNLLVYDFLFRRTRRTVGAPGAALLVFLISGLIHEAVISWPARGGYGLPTAYFLLQGAGLLFERTWLGRRIGLGHGWRGWVFTVMCTAAPAFWLFHPPFVNNVILPFLRVIGAL